MEPGTGRPKLQMIRHWTVNGGGVRYFSRFNFGYLLYWGVGNISLVRKLEILSRTVGTASANVVVSCALSNAVAFTWIWAIDPSGKHSVLNVNFFYSKLLNIYKSRMVSCSVFRHNELQLEITRTSSRYNEIDRIDFFIWRSSAFISIGM